MESIPLEKILIVGGNSGIGLATAGLLKVKYPKAELCMPYKDILDVRSHVGIHAYVRAEGPFSHILYSAGVNELSWVDNPNLDVVMYDAMEVNCFGFAVLLGEHIRQFPSYNFSAVAVSSDAGRIPMRGSIAYCVSKAALNMVVKTLARELAPSCRVNAVAPGMVDGTAMTKYIDEAIPEFREWAPEYARQYELQGTPTKRRATLSEVAETIEWVLTGPGQMTGAIIDINGGR